MHKPKCRWIDKYLPSANTEWQIGLSYVWNLNSICQWMGDVCGICCWPYSYSSVPGMNIEEGGDLESHCSWEVRPGRWSLWNMPRIRLCNYSGKASNTDTPLIINFKWPGTKLNANFNEWIKWIIIMMWWVMTDWECNAKVSFVGS